MSSYKGLTIDEIIQCFTDQKNEVDNKLINIFLYTYRSYCKPLDIIQLICKRIIYLNNEKLESNNCANESIGFTKAIIILFNLWLMAPFSFDFYEVPHFQSLNQLLISIRQWPHEILFIKSSEKFQTSFKRLQDMIDGVLISFNSMDSKEQCGYREIAIDCQFRDSYLFNVDFDDINDNQTFFDFSPDIIANSLSCLDQQALQKLRLPELIKYTRKEAAPSIRHVIDTYNHLYNVVEITVKEPSVVIRRFDQCPNGESSSPESQCSTNPFLANAMKNDSRHNVIEKWILTAEELYSSRNFSSLVAILTALNSTDLKKCMTVLKINKSLKLINLYQSLLKVIEPYINQNKEEVPALGCHKNEIPYLGIYLRSMTYISEGFPDYASSSVKVYDGNNEHLINIDKCRRQFDVMVQVNLLISQLNFNNFKENKAFSDWYSLMQIESKKSKRYSSDRNRISPALSLECLKLHNSNDLTDSSEKSGVFIKPDFKSYIFGSHDRLNSTNGRNRLQSCPSDNLTRILPRNRSVEGKLSIHSTAPKVATVKLKESRNNLNKVNVSNQFNSSTSPSRNKPATISNGFFGVRERPLLPVQTGSPTAAVADCDAVLYKKILIYENDRTEDFVCRVLEKYCISKLLSKDFEVVQILDNGREILMTTNAHLFYALAEKSEYLIEVRRKEIVTV